MSPLAYFVILFFNLFYRPQTTTCLGIYLQVGMLECGIAYPRPNRDLQASSAENTHTKHKKIPDNSELAKVSGPTGEHRPGNKRQAHTCNVKSMSGEEVKVMRKTAQMQTNMRTGPSTESTRNAWQCSMTWKTQDSHANPVGHKSLQRGEYWFHAAMQECKHQRNGNQKSETKQWRVT